MTAFDSGSGASGGGGCIGGRSGTELDLVGLEWCFDGLDRMVSSTDTPKSAAATDDPCASADLAFFDPDDLLRLGQPRDGLLEPKSDDDVSVSIVVVVVVVSSSCSVGAKLTCPVADEDVIVPEPLRPRLGAVASVATAPGSERWRGIAPDSEGA